MEWDASIVLVKMWFYSIATVNCIDVGRRLKLKVHIYLFLPYAEHFISTLAPDAATVKYIGQHAAALARKTPDWLLLYLILKTIIIRQTSIRTTVRKSFVSRAGTLCTVNIEVNADCTSSNTNRGVSIESDLTKPIYLFPKTYSVFLSLYLFRDTSRKSVSLSITTGTR